MSARPRCWGVYRELAHSPGRETDDALILQATAAELEAKGFEVTLKSPDELPEAADASEVPPFLFVMCERIPAVERLASWERRGVRVVNRPDGIRNTDRERTIARFAEWEVAFPESVLVRTAGGDGPDGGPGFPCWVKRGDVHATEAGDVSYAGDPSALAAAFSRLSARGIASAVVQRHVPGDLIKFYGVAGEGESEPLSWFQWFYHRDQTLSGHPFDQGALRALVGRGAAALGLEVFGGDAIVGPDGGIVLIDVNAWPSFALFRPVASTAIAACLAARFRKEAGVPK